MNSIEKARQAGAKYVDAQIKVQFALNSMLEGYSVPEWQHRAMLQSEFGHARDRASKARTDWQEAILGIQETEETK